MPFTLEEAKRWADCVIDFKNRSARGELGAGQARDFADRILKEIDLDMEYSGEYCEWEDYVDSRLDSGVPDFGPDTAGRMRAIAAKADPGWSAEAVIGQYLASIEDEARYGRVDTLLYNAYAEDGKWLGQLHEWQAEELAACLRERGFKAQAAQSDGSNHSSTLDWHVNVSW